MNTWSWTYDAKSDSGESRADRLILWALESGLGKWSGSRVSCSRSHLQKLMENSKVTADAKPITPSHKIKLGTKIEIHFPPPEALDLVAEDVKLDVLYEDSHLLVINKPPGLVVHPADQGSKDGTLVNALLFHIKDLSGIGGKLRPGIVHRIDKDTSGALVITKNDETHRLLADVFSKHEIERKYWALVFGAFPEAKTYKIETTIGRNPADRKKMAANVKQGREAVSFAKKVETYGETGKLPFGSLVEVGLETGRTHQVRVHLTHLGYSIMGDPIYGKPSSRQKKWTDLPGEVQDAVSVLPGQALHARVLGFVHPITKKKLYFVAEPPAQFAQLLAVLRKYEKNAAK
jgi:23S rRNA pseudouridine1911/1915/1917 synthase